MAFKLTTVTAVLACIASTQAKVLRYRQANATLITPSPLSSATGFGTGYLPDYGTAASTGFIPSSSIAAGTGVSPSSSIAAGTGFSQSSASVTASSGFPASSGLPFPTGLPTSGGIPFPTGLPSPKHIPDLAIAFQSAGCNTNGSGPQFSWPNFATGKCQGLFPNPTYEFSSVWVAFTSREFDTCELQIFSDNNCQSPIDGSGTVYNPYGSCIDAADSAGKSFTLNCYNLPIPLV